MSPTPVSSIYIDLSGSVYYHGENAIEVLFETADRYTAVAISDVRLYGFTHRVFPLNDWDQHVGGTDIVGCFKHAEAERIPDTRVIVLTDEEDNLYFSQINAVLPKGVPWWFDVQQVKLPYTPPKWAVRAR